VTWHTDILLFFGRLATYLAKRLGHIIIHINTKIVAFQTHIVGGSSLFLNIISMADERDPSTLYKLFRHDAHAFHYPKVDRIGRNSTRKV
jgi:hypothetical protein